MTTTKSFTELANGIGELVENKNKAYGSAFDKCGDFLKVLYPEGIKPEQYKDMLCIVRVFDKLMRIATSYDGTEEKKVDAYSDLMGYGLLGLRASLEEKEAQTKDKEKQELNADVFPPEQVKRWKEVLDKADEPNTNAIAYSAEEKLIREAAKKEQDLNKKKIARALVMQRLGVQPKSVDEKDQQPLESATRVSNGKATPSSMNY
jgi:hypothetical protein